MQGLKNEYRVTWQGHPVNDLVYEDYAEAVVAAARLDHEFFDLFQAEVHQVEERSVTDWTQLTLDIPVPA